MMPTAVDALFDQAWQAHQGGDEAAARAAYVQVLQHDPGHAQALQLLASIEGQAGRVEQALVLLRRAVEYQPEDARCHHSLGRVLSQCGQLDGALDSLQRAHLLAPEDVRVLEDIGLALFRLNRFEDALKCFERALELDPESLESLTQRAEILQSLVAQKPALREAAVAALRALQFRPHDEAAVRYALAALGAEAVPPAMPASAVMRLFDGYAEKFDAHLTGVLAYRAPELIAQALQRAGAERLPRGLVIDLGCGTGLCGPWLRPLARELVGVDLSAGMLAKAMERGLYDRLSCADLLQALKKDTLPATLVVAADVFVYVGDLDPVFAAVAARLQPGGLFAFSLEDTADGDYRLLSTRRYAHGGPYIQRLAGHHGFETLAVDAVALRQESGVDVAGSVHVLRRLQIAISPEIDGAKK